MNKAQEAYLKKVNDALNSDVSHRMSKSEYKGVLEEISTTIDGMLEAIRDELREDGEDDE